MSAVPAHAPGAPGVPENPFIGPVSYPEGRKLYGREQESAELADLIISRRVVLLYSPSGAGKTSLINTELRREIRLRGKERFRMSKPLRVGMDPGGLAVANRYVFSAIRHLDRSFPQADQLPDEKLAPYTLKAYLDERWDPEMQKQAPKSRWDLLVFDQFEELFTLDATDLDAKRAFFEEVAAAIGNREESDEDAPRTTLRWALFAMREDYIAEVDPFKMVVPTALGVRFRLNLLTREQSSQVIQSTSADAGVTFDDQAIAAIVADLARVRTTRSATERWTEGLYVEPVQLQVVCHRIWNQLVTAEKHHVFAQDLGSRAADDESSMGAVDEALGVFYDECVARAAGGSTTRERSIRDWIEQMLITPARLRSQVLLENTEQMPVRLAEIEALLGRILRKEFRGGREWVELTHDRLVDPALASNNRWRGEHLSLLQMQAYLWNGSGRRDGYLLTGDALQEAAQWASTHDHELQDLDREFLRTALQQQSRERSVQQRRRFLFWGMFTSVATMGLIVALWQQRNATLEQQTINAALSIQTDLSDIRFSLSQADVLRARDLVGSVTAALRSESRLMSRLNGNGDKDHGFSNERITVEASLLDSLRRAPPVTVRFAGHQAAVRALAFTPDGARMISASSDGTLRLWNTATGAMYPRPVDLERPIGAMAVHAGAQGMLIATGDDDGSVRLWRLADTEFTPLAELPRDKSLKAVRVTALGLNAEGNVLVVAGWNREVTFWDVRDPAAPKLLATLPKDERRSVLYGIALNRQGTQLATGSWDGTVQLWSNLPTLANPHAKPQATLLNPDPDAERPTPLNAVAFSPEGQHLAAAGNDGTVFLWKLRGSEAGRAVKLTGKDGHDAAVFALAFTDDGQRLASAGIDRTLILWDVKRAEAWKPGEDLPIDHPIEDVPERLYALAFRPDQPGQIGIAGGRNLFLLDTTQPVSPLATPLVPRILGSAADGRPARWRGVAVSADGKLIAATHEGRVTFWTPTGDDERFRLRNGLGFEHLNLVRFTMDPKGTLAVTGTRDGEVIAWRLADGGVSSQVLVPRSGAPVLGLAAAPDGRYAAAALADALMVWRFDADGTATVIHTQAIPPRSLATLAFDGKGERLAAGASDGTVRMWTVKPDRIDFLAHSVVGHQAVINALAFSPDDQTLATGSEDSTVVQWNLPEVVPIGQPLTEHERGVTSVAFCTRDGVRRLFSSDRDGVVVARLSLNDARHTRALIKSPRQLRYIAVTPSCDLVLTTGDSLLAWDTAPDSIRREACRIGDPGLKGDDPCAAFRRTAEK
jgi:WD40 repeat protein